MNDSTPLCKHPINDVPIRLSIQVLLAIILSITLTTKHYIISEIET